ncbi:hypothetical protein BD779DRAFT_1521910 [Infundibulicybe gibba]|nr:hypothetical protein BD779DRAFT_1521910 [Infundibulicybe gibba]
MNNVPTTSQRIPTIDDLRVKLCYICREEEHSSEQSQSPPVAWTHPCNCTLIAHSSCLLRWVEAAQASPTRAANALKCPQCGEQYDMESENPLLLRLLSRGHALLKKCGRFIFIGGLVGGVAVIGSSIYIVLTSYGAWAVRHFIGQEMFDLLLTSEPSNWSWISYINLPLIPISLVFSRVLNTAVPPIVLLLLAWPSASPVGTHGRLLRDYWAVPERARGLGLSTVTSWPPSPVVVGTLMLPFVRRYYGRAFARLRTWAMQEEDAGAMDTFFGWLRDHGRGRLIVRVIAGMDGEAEARVEGQQGNAPAPAAPNAEAAPNPDPEAGADRIVEVNGSGAGVFFSGTFLIPYIASKMGSLLHRLSAHSSVLRLFLGLREAGGRAWPPPPLGRYTYESGWDGMGPLKRLNLAVKLVAGAAWGGTKTWTEADPVWWRNVIGLGTFVVIKDCIQLLYQVMKKRELESRKIKNKDFSGVDIRELDLMPRFWRQVEL